VRVKRRRRRVLASALAAVYLGAFTWLISPLWRPADAPTAVSAPVHEVRAKRLVGLAPLGASKDLPESLPGSGTAVVAAAETGEEEEVTEAGTEAPVSVLESSEGSESSEASTSPSPSSESNPQPQETIISSEG
jgi:hypothetical protein